jgi:hypothetical protein
MVAELTELGVKENAIIVWDRFETQMRDCKFEFNTSDRGVRIYGTDGVEENVRRYDPDVAYVSDFDNPEQRQDGSTASRISSLFTRDCDKIINMAILKDHGLSGYATTTAGSTVRSTSGRSSRTSAPARTSGRRSSSTSSTAWRPATIRAPRPGIRRSYIRPTRYGWGRTRSPSTPWGARPSTPRGSRKASSPSRRAAEPGTTSSSPPKKAWGSPTLTGSRSSGLSWARNF